MMSHSTAVLSKVFSTDNTLLTVLGAFLQSACLSRCTCSFLTQSSRCDPNRGSKCTRRIVCFEAMLLGF